MILSGGGSGGLNYEQPTSSTYTAWSNTLTLSGVTHKPYCIVYGTRQNLSGTWIGTSVIYCEDENGNILCNQAFGIGYMYEIATATMTYNSSTQKVTLQFNKNVGLPQSEGAANDIFCLYF